MLGVIDLGGNLGSFVIVMLRVEVLATIIGASATSWWVETPV